ncbi:Crp/Fnr family transcriptional regulator, partial [Candidatus Latescibacterota bacterium]
GMDRRQENPTISQEQRQKPDRRELLVNMEDIIARYSKIPLFKNFTSKQMGKILRICSKKKIPNNYNIYRVGQESKDMYILLKGLIKVLLSDGQVWSKVAPFGAIGETRLFNYEYISGDIIAGTECIVLQITKQELFRIFETDKDLYNKMLLNIIGNLAEKLKNDHDEMITLNYRIESLDTI